MSKRDFHDGRQDGLSPLESLDLAKVGSCADLVRRMSRTACGGRQLGRALDILLDVARDPDCMLVLTLSGAMTVAKQGTIICDMIDRGLADAVVATGALVAHGLSESIGLVHYAVDPATDDSDLFDKGYNRIYDTLEMESNLNDVQKLVERVLEEQEPEGGVWCSSSFCRALGRQLEQRDQGRGILRSAHNRGVPVYIPAFTDSEMGLDVAVWAMRRAMRTQKSPSVGGSAVDPQQMFVAAPPFNPFLDLQDYARRISGAKRLAIFTVGGGVPRNWAQQVAPYYDVAAHRLEVTLPAPRFQYGVRICPEPVHWGGLSGCTYSEGVSWGKFAAPDYGGRYAEIHCDATLVLPLLMKAVFEELEIGT